MSAAFFMSSGRSTAARTEKKNRPPHNCGGSDSPALHARRNLGRVFTPKPVADWMAAWACAHRPTSILEPAAGDGVFLRSILECMTRASTWPAPCVDAFEIDDDMLVRCRSSSVALRLTCRRQDFIHTYGIGFYDAALANPPYVKHHRHAVGDAVFAQFDLLCGRRISRMTNLYGLFLLKIWSLLGPRGRAAIITPAEWLNADFGVALKAHLLEENAIDAVVHFDPAATVFSDALTTAAIVLLRRGRGPDDPVRMARAEDPSHLPSLDGRDFQEMPPSMLDPQRKWSPLFHRDAMLDSRRAQGPHAAAPVRRPVLGDVATCSRGIATGANGYFILRESQRRQWGISPRDLRPCISKARQIRSDVLEAEQVHDLVSADEPVFLLHPRQALAPAVERYLAEGRKRGVDRRYLPSHRPTWFRPEQRPPAPILISVFARGDFRVVVNRAGVLNLTAYHGIYLRAHAAKRVPELAVYLQSPQGQAAIAQHRRVYGGGLYKLEPRDVEAVAVPYEFAESGLFM